MCRADDRSRAERKAVRQQRLERKRCVEEAPICISLQFLFSAKLHQSNVGAQTAARSLFRRE